MVNEIVKSYMCIKHLNKLLTHQDIDLKEARKMLTVLSNISIKRTLYSVANDRLTCTKIKWAKSSFIILSITTVNLFCLI